MLFFLQLAPYSSSGEEHGLSINADVALWLDCRTFHKNPPLQIVSDFVVVSNELHDEFDNFKGSETELSISLLPAVELLRFWLSRTGLSLPTIAKYGKLYIPLNCSQLDDLCSWVSEMREQFIHLGRRMFEGTCTSAVDTEVETSSSSPPAGVFSSKEKEELPLEGKASIPVRPSSGKMLRKTGKGPILIQNKGQKVSCRVNSLATLIISCCYTLSSGYTVWISTTMTEL